MIEEQLRFHLEEYKELHRGSVVLLLRDLGPAFFA